MYFGPSQKSLFGVYHPPAGSPHRSSAVLLCYPIGHEYIRTHRALRNLAVQLSAAGFHVLRFDYYGTGDSAGEAEDTRVPQCLADIETAIEELKDLSTVRRVSLVGLRLGATLAAMVTTRRRDIDRLVALDPIDDGSTYVSRLRSLHERWIDTRPWSRPTGHNTLPEVIGFPFPDELEQQLERLAPGGLTRSLARRVSVIVSGEAPDSCRALMAALSDSSECVEVRSQVDDWSNPLSVHQSFQLQGLLEAAVGVLV
jgi:pimeloyl-ACP methyl ester carboxylesterase